MAQYVPPPKKAPKPAKFDLLEHAIVDGVPLFGVGDTVIMRRDHRADKQISVCKITKISENGDVYLDDETLVQCFTFNMGNPPTLRLPEKKKKKDEGVNH